MVGAPPPDPGTAGPQVADDGAAGRPLRALVVDDEAPALEELRWLLSQDSRVGEVRTATSGADAATNGAERSRNTRGAPYVGDSDERSIHER